jgi:DNA-binding MarR family transcriptional regulator
MALAARDRQRLPARRVPASRDRAQLGNRPPEANEHGLDAQLVRLSEALREVLGSVHRLRGRHARSPHEHAMTHAQFELLACLLERGELHAGELAHAAQVSPATVSGMLDQLVAARHVERVRSERDRRVVVCRLTPAGRELLERKNALWQARWRAQLGALPPADLEAATRVLRLIAATFDRAAAEPAAGVPEAPARGNRAAGS